jgi:exosome complex RNA-binding protein Rrp4
VNKHIAVECTIGRNGRVWVRRLKLDESWLAVEQGRQWQDEAGRHVLVMYGDGRVDEILLSAATLRWELVPRRSGTQVI